MNVIDNVARLTAEREKLQECLAAYDCAIRHFESQSGVTDEAVDWLESASAMTGVESLTAQLRKAIDVAPVGSSGEERIWRGRRRLSILMLALLLAATTTYGVWWWHNIRPVQTALQMLQGAWQRSDVDEFGESTKDYFKRYDGNQLLVEFPTPPKQQWHKYTHRIELKPASDFFVINVKSEADQRPNRELDMYVRITEGRVHEIRGLHPLDPIRIPVIHSWRPGSPENSEASADREM